MSDDATIYMGKIAAELLRAEQKFPGFPTDPIHAAAIVAEECGELQQAALQCTYEGKEPEALEGEAIHTGAMALRFLIHLKHMRPRRCEQVSGTGKVNREKGAAPTDSPVPR